MRAAARRAGGSYIHARTPPARTMAPALRGLALRQGGAGIRALLCKRWAACCDAGVRAERVLGPSGAESPRAASTYSGQAVVAQLQSRSVLRVRGRDALPFLQGMVTQDVLALPASAPGAPTRYSLSYSALLNAQGRIIDDIFFHFGRAEPDLLLPGQEGDAGEDEEEEEEEEEEDDDDDDVDATPDARTPNAIFFADVDSGSAQSVLRYLQLAKLRADVDFQLVDDHWEVCQVFSESVPPATLAASLRGAGWELDPRSSCLGLRALVPKGNVEGSRAELQQLRHDVLGALKSVGGDGVSSTAMAGEDAWREFRYLHGVAEGSREMAQGLPLEYNLAGTLACASASPCLCLAGQ
eukprot:scaffold59_cov411-Prasinococcus_capsulatus_cf.AAC.4